MHRVTQVKVLQGFKLALRFEDGTEGHVDLSYLAGKGVFRLWEDREAFEDVRIGSTGELVWSDRIDLCPDALYLKVTGKDASSILAPPPAEASHA